LSDYNEQHLIRVLGITYYWHPDTHTEFRDTYGLYLERAWQRFTPTEILVMVELVEEAIAQRAEEAA